MQLIQGEETIVIDVTPALDVDRFRLRSKLIEDVDIGHLAVRNPDKHWDIATQIEQDMELDGSFSLPEACPGKERTSEVNRCGIESVHCL